MSDAKTAPADDYETQVGDVSGAVHTGRGDIIHIEKIELMADRAGETLQRALPTGKEARAELRQVIAELTALQAQMTEWKELHHLLHEVLTAFSPFHARLVPFSEGGFTAAERQALLQNWRPCQDEIDMVTDFACGIEYIGKPFERAGRELRGERWAVEIVALQLLLEDALKEESPSPQSLLELAEEFNSACHRHLALADRKLRAAVDRLQQLSTRLLGGML
jgi:hypothetical protein